MKRIWVRVEPWDKEVAITALEAGADAVVLAAGDAPRMRELGAMPVVAPDGDLVPGREVVWREIASKADEESVASEDLDKTVVLRTSDWTVIPLENLLARRGKLMLEVKTAEEARLALTVLEKGVDGVVLSSPSADEVRTIAGLVHAVVPRVPLVSAIITAVRPLGTGDRVCLDTVTNMVPGEGMLVGNSGSGFFLVHSESLENPYVAARPFRVNAGAVHAYLYLPEARTKYLSELKAGDEVLTVRHDGTAAVSYLGRAKIERRPLLLVEAEAEGRPVSLVLQNAETIRLTSPEGEALPVTALKLGDRVLAHVTTGGRHFGMAVEETITER